MQRVASIFWTVLVAGGAIGLAQGRADQYAQADIQYGSRIYAAQCTGCHGPEGNSIAGIDLRAGRFRRVSSDSDLRTIVTTGIAGTAMPPFKFDASELAGIVAYIRNMREFDARAVPLGDPDRGRALVDGSGACLTCHRINGRGSLVAPDLSDVGAQRTAEALQTVLVDPNGWILPQHRSVRAVTNAGKVITGRRLNEDTYTVQLIDAQQHLVSLVKADLREYSVGSTSGMPSYKEKLTPPQIADVVAYLLSLKELK